MSHCILRARSLSKVLVDHEVSMLDAPVDSWAWFKLNKRRTLKDSFLHLGAPVSLWSPSSCTPTCTSVRYVIKFSTLFKTVSSFLKLERGTCGRRQCSPRLWTPPSALSSPSPRRTSGAQPTACRYLSLPKRRIFWFVQLVNNLHRNLFSIWREASIWPASTSSPGGDGEGDGDDGGKR